MKCDKSLNSQNKLIIKNANKNRKGVVDFNIRLKILDK